MIEGINPIQPGLKHVMNRMANILDIFLNIPHEDNVEGIENAESYFVDNKRKYGFCLFVFDFNERGMINYISNAERDSMIKALEEVLEKFKEERRMGN